MISYKPSLKLITDLDNLKLASDSVLLQGTGLNQVLNNFSVNMELDISNNKIIFSKPGQPVESTVVVKKWYSE